MTLNALVVDDDAMILDLLENILKREGYTITRADDGYAAIKLLDMGSFDLVITDLQMGQSSGFDVIRKAKSANNKTTVVMITGCNDLSCRDDAFRYGADDFLQKPFSLYGLQEILPREESKQFYSYPSTQVMEENIVTVSG